MARLRVVVDARPLSHPQFGGFRSYLRALLQGMNERAGAGKDLPQLLLYIDRDLSSETLRSLPPGTETRLLAPNRLLADWRLWETQIRLDQPDLVFGTQNYLPPCGAVPTVLVMHDAMGIKRYEWDENTRRTLKERVINRYWHYQTLASGRRARRIIAVSAGARDEIQSALLDIPESRFAVVYNGVALPAPQYNGDRDTNSLLCIASPDPRKNLALVYDALAHHPEQFGNKLPLLRVVCTSASVATRTRTTLEARGLPAELLTGLNNQRLADAYAQAGVFVWPSHHEGFGLPPLEMMGTGGAVASSIAVCMPEVLGDAPVYFSPHNPVELANAVRPLLGSRGRQRERGEKGRVHAASFTCRRMADETIAVWESAV